MSENDRKSEAAPARGQGGMRRGMRPGGPGGGGPAGALAVPPEKAKHFKKTFRRLVSYLAPEKYRFFAVFVLAVFSTVFSVLGPKIVGSVTNRLADEVTAKLQGTAYGIDFSYIGKTLLILAGLYVTSALASFVMGFLMSGVAQRSVYSLRKESKEKLDRLPLTYYDTHTHGEIMSRITNDLDTVATTLQQSLTQLITSAVTLIGILIMMLTISPVLTLIALVSLPLSVFLTMTVAKRSQRYFKNQQKTLGELNGHVEEMLSGHVIIQAFGREEASVREFDEINNSLFGSAWRAQFMSGVMMPALNFVSNLGYVVVCVAGGVFVTKGYVKIGDVGAFISYMRQFTQPIVQTANIANVIQSAIAGAERVFELLDEREDVTERDSVRGDSPVRGEVVFENVRFGYSEDNILIENMNINVSPGQTIAIVGPTGAGKTTVVNLLMRFYELAGGRILVDGADITEMSRERLHGIYGMVLQDTWLFSGTIAENIAYGRAFQPASREEIESASYAAYADKFIRTLPEGYDTVLNEEASNISQGQKQLLTIARAFLKDPAILILDEATSSVDTRTEALIQIAMGRLMKGRTCFVIAHRLSTIQNADLILVMKCGSIIETGTHEELLNAGGFYAEMYNA